MNIRLYICSFLILFLAVNGFTQAEKKITGTWQGTLNAGIQLRIVFHINQTDNLLTATLDSPDQGMYGMKCDSVFLYSDSVHISMLRIRAVFRGKLVTDSVINGIFTQGASLPLVLNKGEQAAPEPNRPQTPKPPFPYKSEDVEYENKDQSLRYGATITIPEGKGPFPAAVLITGSGQQDRDETLMGHKVFAVLADALTRNGFVILRVDDRGIGKSTGQFKDATSADFVNDVITSLDYLLSRPEVDKKKTGLIGHSEGGMIAPIIAAQRKDIDFMVLLAGPGIKIDQLMAEQNAAILRSAGISQGAIDAYLPFYKKIMHTAITSPDTASAMVIADSLLQQWVSATDPLLLKEMGFDMPESSREIVQRLIGEFSGKWFRYFLAFDPKPYLKKIRAKVLALNGNRDIQVLSTSNLSGISNALEKGRAKTYTIKILPGLNHLFQTCKECTVSEYGQLEETFSPAALKEINDWLNNFVK